MKNRSGISKYYLVFFILLAVTIGLTIYTLSGASSAKEDARTAQKIGDVANNLSNFTSNHNYVPESLAAADIKNVPPSIKYTKISDTKYQVCVNYRNASTPFDGGWTSLLTGALIAGSNPSYSAGTSTPSPFFDTFTLAYYHKKGDNCQTVEPFMYSSPTLSAPASSDTSTSI